MQSSLRHGVSSLVIAAATLLAAVPAALGADPVETEKTALSVRIKGRVAKQQVYAQLEGVIEYVACCPGGKEYESLFVCDADPQALFDSLVRSGVRAGTPARDEADKYILPTGGRVTISVEWNRGGWGRRAPLETFVLDTATGQPMPSVEWIFTGSRQSRDPATGKTMLEALTVKNLISLHHLDPTVLIQNSLQAARDDGRYKANLAALPPEGTAVTLVLAPVHSARAGDADKPVRTMHALIHGRVQGVGFRAFTQRHARRLGLKGWVRNLPGGEVELVAAGSEQSLSRLEERVRKGPRGAKVERVVLSPAEGDAALGAFEVRATPSGKN